MGKEGLQKDTRTNNTKRKIMATTIRYRKGKDGFITPYFDHHYGGQRWTEFLPLLKYKENPKTFEERKNSKENQELLNRVLRERELQMALGEYNIKPKYNTSVNFYEYIEEYIKNYPNKGDLRAYNSMFRQLKAFVKKPKLYAYEVDEAFVRRFVKYLETNLQYETPLTYFKKFKKILKFATKQNVFKSNPAEDVQVRKHQVREKDILNADEIKLLVKAKCCNHQTKAAFLFAFYTALRFVDVKKLKWRNINGSTLTITQSKTRIPITLPIHPSALELLGERTHPEDLVFNLPSHTACLKAIRNWVKDAGIDKKITFHCARHSAGSLLVANGVDISTTARLLGHTSLKHTMRYVRTSETLKLEAINTLPIL